MVNYQNKCRLIRGWDDLFNKVKEHINSVSAMKLSPYYKVSCFSPVLFEFEFSMISAVASKLYEKRAVSEFVTSQRMLLRNESISSPTV